MNSRMKMMNLVATKVNQIQLMISGSIRFEEPRKEIKFVAILGQREIRWSITENLVQSEKN